MSREYIFNHYTSMIDIYQDGYEPSLDSKWKSFLWDKNIKGIILKQDVHSNGDVDVEKTVKIRLAIIKDLDCQELKEAASRYNYWEFTKGKVSPTIMIDDAAYQKILGIYNEAYQKSITEIDSKIIQKLDIDYSMPIGQWEDTLILTIPIDNSVLEPNTLYRIGIYECDGIPTFCHEWSWFDFFQFQKPIEEIFVPHSAYLKVRKQIRRKLYFDKATNYRHYKDYFSDIHFDRVCEEVEVNPTLVCFELNVKCNKKNLPIFNIIMSSKNTIIHSDFCRLVTMERTNRIVAFCSLSVEDFYVKDYNEITTSLQVFGRTIACFSFLTNRTERGVFKF